MEIWKEALSVGRVSQSVARAWHASLLRARSGCAVRADKLSWSRQVLASAGKKLEERVAAIREWDASRSPVESTCSITKGEAGFGTNISVEGIVGGCTPGGPAEVHAAPIDAFTISCHR
eukprot:SAG11_NODE_3783_length_2229_cov_1.594366_2_plen_119_part_00